MGHLSFHTQHIEIKRKIYYAEHMKSVALAGMSSAIQYALGGDTHLI